MPGAQSPAVALANPLVRHPVVAGTARDPMAPNPYMAATHPVPVAADPSESRLRGRTHDFDPGRGRRNHHHAVGVMPLIRFDHAT